MRNKILGVLALAVSLVIGGCGHLLYSDKMAPVYSAQTLKITPPEKIPQSKTIENINNAQSIEIRSDVDNPYQALPAAPLRPNTIEKTRDTGVIDVTKEMTTAKNSQQTQPAAPASRPNPQNKTRLNKTPKERLQTPQVANTVAKQPLVPPPPKRPQPATQQSAARALLQEAKTAVGEGNYDKAAAALERAHRIEPGNAKILYDIAQIRYAQGKYRQAESFASKAASYSAAANLSKKIWQLLSRARKALGNVTGAEAAAKRAANF